ncbi:MAG: Xaa-Pro peptidase family protein [Candidatus Bathyarchaeota archaeon]|nr:Xaa-Pro peptidase family protein [Candidatus Bathyarchaeota archaeon]
MDRIGALRKTAFGESGFGYLILNGANMLYFLGFPGASALLVPPDGECTVYVGGVNYEQAKAAGKGFNVALFRGGENLMTRIADQAKECQIGRLLVDALNVQNWQALTTDLQGGCKVEVNCSYVQKLRAVKDPAEVGLMRVAGELTSRGMEAAAEAVKAGAKEYEVAAEAEYAMRRRGAGPSAFETIVASGAGSAFPHGGCGDREIRDGDLVVVDIGATYNHYCSDMTRTFVAGKPTAKQQRIYDAVKTAHQSAFQKIRAGVCVADVDAAARNVLKDAGYGEFFVHRVGHNVGLEVHEPPSLNPDSPDLLAAGNVVTDEPGVYISGFGGVRIEDTVLVQKDGCEKLTVGAYSLVP